MAVHLDGVNEHLSVGTDIFTGGAPLSMAAWVQLDVHPAIGGSDIIFSLGGNNVSSQTESWYISLFRTAAPITTVIGTIISAGASSGLSGGIVVLGGWFHVTFVVHSPTLLSLWIGGTQIGPTTVTSRVPVPVGEEDTVIGDWVWAQPLFPFDGKLAEAAIWDFALNETEITALNNGARADHVSSPIEYWRVSPDTLDDPDLAAVVRPDNDFDHVNTPTFEAHPVNTSPIPFIRHHRQLIGS